MMNIEFVNIHEYSVINECWASLFSSIFDKILANMYPFTAKLTNRYNFS